MANPKLQNLLYMVLVAGNFLNSGGYAGNAAGMKISSLHKLTDIRSNRPGLNLLQYIVGQIEATQPDLLSVVDDLAILEEASKTTIDTLNGDINKLVTQITKISREVAQASTEPEVQEQLAEFLPVSAGTMAPWHPGTMAPWHPGTLACSGLAAAAPLAGLVCNDSSPIAPQHLLTVAP